MKNWTKLVIYLLDLKYISVQKKYSMKTSVCCHAEQRDTNHSFRHQFDYVACVLHRRAMEIYIDVENVHYFQPYLVSP